MHAGLRWRMGQLFTRTGNVAFRDISSPTNMEAAFSTAQHPRLYRQLDTACRDPPPTFRGCSHRTSLDNALRCYTAIPHERTP